jgi:hypothetical protein
MSDRGLLRASTWIIVACLGTLALTVALFATPSLRNRLFADASLSSVYASGEIVDLPGEVYQGQSFTLIYFATTTCAACLQAREAMRELADAISDGVEDVEVALVTATTDRDARAAFGEAVGVNANRHFSLDLSQLKVRKVPTVLLVDKMGRVLFAQERAPDSATHSAILDRVKSETMN